MMIKPTPTVSGIPRRSGDFATFTQALDYAAQGETGFNFYSGRGELLEALPYHTLREQAQTVARKLMGMGLKRGACVAIVAESDGDFARIFFGCQYAGLVPAPLPLPVAFAGRDGYISTLRGMICACEAAVLVAPSLIESWIEDIAAGLSLSFAGTPAALQALPEADSPLPEIHPHETSYLQFSSGSTRFPTGVVITHQAGLANASAIAKYGLVVTDIDDRCVSWLPLYHDMGLVGFFLTPMTSQASVDLMPTREFARRPHTWLNLISRNRGTLSYSPSFGFELCSRRPVPPDIDLSCWRAAGIGGDMIRPHVLEEFAEKFKDSGFNPNAFVASYGMAEATLALSFAPLRQGLRKDTVDLRVLETQNIARPPFNPAAPSRSFVLCGPILPGHEIEVRNSKGEVLEERHVGSIYVRGPSLMKGYYNQPEETARILDEDGWLNTGDLGYMLDGQIVITGRAKDLIVINGRNIWPQDLEWAAEARIDALRSHDVAVFSVDDGAQERIVALVQCRLGAPELREALRTDIANLFRREHGADVCVILVPPHSLPQTSSGKLTRAKAKAMLLSGAFETEPSSSVA